MIVTRPQKKQAGCRSRNMKNRGCGQRQGQTLARHLTDAAIQLAGDRRTRLRTTLTDKCASSPGQRGQWVLVSCRQPKQVALKQCKTAYDHRPEMPSPKGIAHYRRFYHNLCSYRRCLQCRAGTAPPRTPQGAALTISERDSYLDYLDSCMSVPKCYTFGDGRGIMSFSGTRNALILLD